MNGVLVFMIMKLNKINVM